MNILNLKTIILSRVVDPDLFDPGSRIQYFSSIWIRIWIHKVKVYFSSFFAPGSGFQITLWIYKVFKSGSNQDPDPQP
jgi:hypothetical protein